MYRPDGGIRRQVRAFHVKRCSDREIAAYLGCPLWYVRQCLNRPAREGRYRAPPPAAHFHAAREARA